MEQSPFNLKLKSSRLVTTNLLTLQLKLWNPHHNFPLFVAFHLLNSQLKNRGAHFTVPYYICRSCFSNCRIITLHLLSNNFHYSFSMPLAFKLVWRLSKPNIFIICANFLYKSSILYKKAKISFVVSRYFSPTTKAKLFDMGKVST